MSARHKLDGTWKSDRERSFEDFVPKPGVTEDAVRRLKEIFGKLVIRWEKRNFLTELDGQKDSKPYKVIAADEDTVTIRYLEKLAGMRLIRKIHFEDDYYWLELVPGYLREYFRRIPDEEANQIAWFTDTGSWFKRVRNWLAWLIT